MGLQNKTKGASLLVIDQACDNDQLLVSLSKNGIQWLSPVGWTDQQKVTLLDCRANGEMTEIDIPAAFAKDISSGDILVLRCSELDLEKEIVWEASEVETRSAEDVVPAATGLAGGLLSRFTGSKVEITEEIKSEAEVRAEEADRAAQNFKVKMEAATVAKEEAQRKALDAAREAEAALKMEADRIAEMERAAIAFEEAERLKQDELRRVEEERRIEELRLAEEARRIEEANKREIAAKKEAERKAALERYEAALDITYDEGLRLKTRLKAIKSRAKSEAENIAVQAEDLQSRRGLMINSEDGVKKCFNSYEKSASKLDAINANLSMLQSESETLGADRQALSIRLSQADLDYQQAQTEAEKAMAHAEACRAELDIIRREESDVSGKMSSLSERLAEQSQAVESVSEKTQKLQLKYKTAQAELAQAKVEIEALEHAMGVQAEQDQNSRLEIEATQQAIEDSEFREATHREAIAHLESGGAPEDIAEVDFEARSFETASINYDVEGEEPVIAQSESIGLKDRMMGRVRRSFAREKDAEISIDIEDVVLDVVEANIDTVILGGLDDRPSFMRRHGSSLMALGVVMGGVAILGGGYAINQSATPKLEVKSSTPMPTQVVSAVTRVESPKALEIKESLEANVKTTPSDGLPVSIDLPTIDAIDIEPSKTELAEVEASTGVEAALLTKEAIVAGEVKETPFVVKLADVVDPTGFAFELPDMMPTAESKQTEMEPAIKEPQAKKVTPKAPVPVKKDQSIAKPKVEVAVNYPELTSDVQTRLTTLGFYTGKIDGQQGKATKEAITNFKTLYSMPVDSKITGGLLTELKRAERDQEAAKILQAAEAEAQAVIQVAEVEVAPVVEFYDTVPAMPSTPIVTDSLPATRSIVPAAETIPSFVAPEPEAAKVASIPVVTKPVPVPAPVVQDVIVEAKVIKNASADYPTKAERRNYYVNVAIVVNYDIDVTGRPKNINIASNDHSGRFNDSFEKEAIKAITRLRYEPKTLNGTAVETKGRDKRIVFRAE